MWKLKTKRGFAIFFPSIQARTENHTKREKKNTK